MKIPKYIALLHGFGKWGWHEVHEQNYARQKVQAWSMAHGAAHNVGIVWFPEAVTNWQYDVTGIAIFEKLEGGMPYLTGKLFKDHGFVAGGGATILHGDAIYFRPGQIAFDLSTRSPVLRSKNENYLKNHKKIF